jgi:hypothetical protein
LRKIKILFDDGGTLTAHIRDKDHKRLLRSLGIEKNNPKRWKTYLKRFLALKGGQMD